MGFYCLANQTDADPLTSLTSPEEFSTRWEASSEYKALLQEITEYETSHALRGEHVKSFEHSRRLRQVKYQRWLSPCTLSYIQQVLLYLGGATGVHAPIQL